MKQFMRLFFRLLYHQLAFTYDLVAASVSFNRWKDWVMSVVPFIEGDRVLEIGHGPGHLQRVLLGRQLVPVAIDESRQMGFLAKRNTGGRARLTRGLAQHLPFPSGSFNTIVSTFPSSYINDSQTLAEVKRCLLNGGRLIILPVAWPKNPFLDWLFRVTGESPFEAVELVKAKFKEPLVKAGFETEVKMLDVKSSLLLIVLAKKPSRSRNILG
ncbi:MAG TPA: methyltransferase domain-containing protein [Anaerolineales bacterium]|nr:methyltransferase domain-containing protein [Anaerolineales bacterium]